MIDMTIFRVLPAKAGVAATRLAATSALVAGILLAAFALRAQALTIEIVGSGTNLIPIAVVPFGGEQDMAQPLAPVIQADLGRSGYFNVLPTADLPPSFAIDQTDYAAWRARATQAVVLGRVDKVGGDYRVEFRVFDAAKGVSVAGQAITFPPARSRQVAHRIADIVQEALTGVPGVAATRIAYVTKSGKVYKLTVADSDGFDPRVVLSSTEPIISPAWSPDGNRLAYVSFEQKKPVVYVQNVFTGQRKAVAAFKGSNSAPAWSPDGRSLAVVLSRDGGSQIFSVSAEGGEARRVARSAGIDTEPDYSPDGRWIYFTSDRGGSPQIYRVPAEGGAVSRVTFKGSYNVSPHISPDGKDMAYVTNAGGGFRVAVQDLASGQSQIVTETRQDESPSFAPNGKMILYAAELGGRGVLFATAADGRGKYRLSVPEGDVREPAWGPYYK